MKKQWLKRLAAFSFDDAGGAPVVEEVVSAEGAPEASEPSDVSAYTGSKEVNPEGRSLKDFDRSAFSSTEEIDAFLKELGEEAFVPKDKPADKSADKPADKSADKPADKPAEAEEENFLKAVGLSKEEFLKLPEKVQDFLADKVAGSEVDPIAKEHEELKAAHTALSADVELIKKDVVVAARLEEIATGKQYTAKDLPAVTRSEVRSLAEIAGDPDAFEEALNTLLVSKADKVLKIERGVLDRKVAREAQEQEALKVLEKIIALEPRIGIKEKDLSKINDSHPEYSKLFGEDGLVGMLQKKRYSPLQIATKGAEELLREFAALKGWDKARDNEIAKNGAKKLLANIRKATEGARTLSLDKVAQTDRPATGGFDRESLITEIAGGDTSNWSRLSRQAEHSGNVTLLNQLTEIFTKGEALRRSNK